MALTEFTSYSEVRSALGVSIDELGDAELGLPIYEFGLQVELESVALEVISQFRLAMAVPEISRTDQEIRLIRGVKLFSTYSVAFQLTTSLPLFSPKEQGDNKATLVRYSADPYKAVIEAVKAQVAKYKAYLDVVYNDYLSKTTVVSVRTLFAISNSTTVDPVTGT